MTKKFTYIIFASLITLFLLATHCLALSPSSDSIYEGIDVSNWQGFIDYEDVKNSGIQIVYIKSSQGQNITDPYFMINYKNAKDNNLYVRLLSFFNS